MCNKEVQDCAVREIARVLKNGGYLQYLDLVKRSVFKKKPYSSQFRNLEDIEKQYGEYFEILEVKKRQLERMSWGANGVEYINEEEVIKYEYTFSYQ
jgi:SAM-dependent methyltransferase